MKPSCLETRRKGPLVFRRYRKASGRDIRTVEIPATIYRSLRHMIDLRAAAWERGEQARDRLAQIIALAEGGNKQEYIAAVLGVSQQYVSKALKNRRTRQKEKQPCGN